MAELTELEQLFPSKKIHLYGKVYVTVTSLPLSKIPEIIEVLTPLLNPGNTKLEIKDMAALVTKHVMEILPLCIDMSMEKVPIAVLPEILDIIIAFNFPIHTIKKYLALAEKIKEVKEILGGKAKASVKQ